MLVILECAVHEIRLRILEPIVVPGRIEAKDLPIVVMEVEEARLALLGKARVLQQRVKIGVPA